MSKRNKIITALASFTMCLALIIFLVINFFSKDTPPDHSSELYQKLYKTFTLLGGSDLDNTKTIKKNLHNLLDSPNEGTINFEITSLPGNKSLEHFGITANYQNDTAKKTAVAMINTDFKDIKLLSGRFELEDTVLKASIPSLYKGIITLDTLGLSDRLNNSVMGIFIKDLIDINVFDKINYDNIFKGDISDIFESIDYNKFSLNVVNEFTNLYEDDAKIIKDNIYTIKEENGDFTFVIKNKAIKLLIIDIGNYIFEGETPCKLIDLYLTQEYRANSQISKYYSLEDYKKTYKNNLKDSVSDTTALLADVINFNINVSVTIDKNGRIDKITYNKGDENIALDLCIDFIYTDNSCDFTSYVNATLASTDYRFDFSKEHKVLSDTSESVFFTAKTGENTNTLSITYDYEDISKSSCKTDIVFSLMTNDVTKATAALNADIHTLSYDIIPMSGKELDVMNMSFKDLKSLLTEIQTNFESLERMFK